MDSISKIEWKKNFPSRMNPIWIKGNKIFLTFNYADKKFSTKYLNNFVKN